MREVIVGGGLRVRSGQSLRQTIRVEHLTPGDVRTIRGDWLPEGRARALAARPAAREARRRLALAQGARRRGGQERRSRALDPTGADRPRLDAARLLLDREEAVIRCEAA